MNCPPLDYYYEHYLQFVDSINQNQYQFLNQDLNKISDSFSKTERKITITHDMQNGYKQDNNPGQNTSDLKVPYRINYFSGTDFFNYFSHHFVTIPTISYIKVGHQLGNKVLGTLIIEKTLLYNDILLDLTDPNKSFITNLLNQMKTKNFDGFLLNFEATTIQNAQTNVIDLVIKWVKLFYEEMKKIDQEYILIWYDSLNYFGLVNWQGEVNQQNMAFGSYSDYFFLDYRWNEQTLKNSENFLPQKKIMPGIDIWGRGSVKGGFDFSSSLEKTIDYSVAIFAPGYSYENLDGEKSREYLERNDKQLWQGFYIDKIQEIIKFDNTSHYEIYVPFKQQISELENFDINFELKFSTKEDQKFGYKQGESIASINSDTSIINSEMIQPQQFQQKDFYNLVLYQSDIYNIKEQIYSFQVNVQITCEQICQDIKLQKFLIYSFQRKQHSAIEYMQQKYITNLPINSFFNIGHGNNFFFNGLKTEYQNYDYIIDYDINLIPSLNPIPIHLKSGNLIQNYFTQIDNNDSYFGTSCLRIGSLLKPYQYFSHLLYTIQVPDDQFFIRVIYKLHNITKQGTISKFLILDEENEKINNKIKQTVKKLQNGWIMLIIQVDNTQQGKKKLVLQSEYSPVNKKQESVLDIKIGQISILKDLSVLDSTIDQGVLNLTYSARYNIADQSVYDLYIKLNFLDNNLGIQSCMLFRDDVFLFNIYFTEFKVKDLKFRPQQNDIETFRLICVTNKGIFLQVDQKIIIKKEKIIKFELTEQLY